MTIKCPQCDSENTDTARFCSNCATPLPDIDGVVHTKTLEKPIEDLTTGSTFAGRYQIIEELGKGGMGKVYKVLDKETNEKVALKLIKPEISSDKKTIERFRNELTTARKIGHRNVCRMYDLNREEGSYYITMEYVPGEDLKSFIRRSGQLAVSTSIRIAKQICEGLTEAHRIDVVHRDLKPSNIMVDTEGSARIMDFGIARTIKEKRITGSGVMIGTPEYMSPEQVEAKEVDQRSDIYSLGIIIYEMLTGRLPFEADTPFAVGIMQKSEVPKDPKELNPQIPDDLSRVILKCLEKDKENRYQRAGDIKSDLEKIEKGLPTTDRVIPKKKTLTSQEITVQFSMKKIFIPAFAVIALIVIGLVIWSPWKYREISTSPASRTSLAVAYFNNRLQVQDLDKNIIEMFSINLSRFEGIRVISQQLLSDVFSQIKKDPSGKIDESTALGVARQVGVDYIVAGSVFEVGEKISMTTQLIEVRRGENVAYEEAQGKTINDIGRMVDVLTEKLSQELGITRDAAEPVKIADVTTESLEAFGHYRSGITHLLRFNNSEAIEEFQRAIDIDPEFAAAYVSLSFAQAGFTAIWNPYTDTAQSKETLAQAERLSHKIREQERMMIGVQKAFLERDSQKYKERAYDFVEKYPEHELANFSLYMAYFANGEFENSKNVIEKYLEINPAHAFSYNMLAYCQARLKNYTEAVSAVNKYIALDSDIPEPYDSGWEVCMITGEYEKALEYCRKALEKFPEAYGYYNHMGHTYLLMGDVELARSMYRLYYSQGLEGSAQEWRKRWYGGLAFLYEGKLMNAFSEFEQRYDMARKAENLWQMSRTLQDLGKILIYQGNYSEAVATLEKAEKISSEIEDISFNPFIVLCQYKIGLAQIGMRDLDSAQRASENIKQYIQEQGVEAFYLNFAYLLEGASHAAQKKGAAVLKSLERCSTSFKGGPDFIKLSAATCVLNNELAQAVEHYQSFKTDISMSRYGNDAISFFRCSSLADYNLGKVYELMGNEAEAIEHFEKFLDLWKDADHGLTEVEDAKKRLAALRIQ